MPQPEKPTNHLTPDKGQALEVANKKARTSGSASSEFQPVHNFRPGRQAATQPVANKGQALEFRAEMRDPTVLHPVDSGLSITSQANKGQALANKGQALELRAEMRDPTVLHLFDSGLSITSGCWRGVSAVCFAGAAHYRHI